MPASQNLVAFSSVMASPRPLWTAAAMRDSNSTKVDSVNRTSDSGGMVSWGILNF